MGGGGGDYVTYARSAVTRKLRSGYPLLEYFSHSCAIPALMQRLLLPSDYTRPNSLSPSSLVLLLAIVEFVFWLDLGRPFIFSCLTCSDALAFDLTSTTALRSLQLYWD